MKLRKMRRFKPSEIYVDLYRHDWMIRPVQRIGLVVQKGGKANCYPDLPMITFEKLFQMGDRLR